MNATIRALQPRSSQSIDMILFMRQAWIVVLLRKGRYGRSMNQVIRCDIVGLLQVSPVRLGHKIGDLFFTKPPYTVLAKKKPPQNTQAQCCLLAAETMGKPGCV
jgi:hypothetical protein